MKVRVRLSALDAAMAEMRRADDGLETGGILVGTDDGDTIDIRAASAPGPNAVRQSKFFLRDRDFAQRFVEEAFARDGSDWIGEWHSHPAADPVPSALDIATYRALLADPTLGFERFVAVIFTPKASEMIAFAVWIIEPDHATSVVPDIVRAGCDPSFRQ